MLGGGTRDARRTELYLDGLMAADERHAHEVPVDVDLDPGVLLAARELRNGLVRVHPSFRFEEALAARLAAGAARLKSGLQVQEQGLAPEPGTIATFRGPIAAGADSQAEAAVPAATSASRSREIWPVTAFRRLPEMAAGTKRPFIMGGVGVGVASAALSLGAVYVAWRYSHPASGRMGRAVRAAHGRSSHSGRRSGVINETRGVVS
jgi:hypothetical protein